MVLSIPTYSVVPASPMISTVPPAASILARAAADTACARTVSARSISPGRGS